MKKHLLIGFFLAAVSVCNAQQWQTRSGVTSFFSETVAENISAKNSQTACILDAKTGEMVIKMRIVHFQFPNKLMQEHFNENYMESDKFPEATFRGKLDAPLPTANGIYTVTVSGVLLIHGKAQPRTITGTIEITDKKIRLQTSFQIVLEDHNIERPAIVMVKIAEKVSVKADYILEKI
jgi:YceI-like domain